MPRQKKAAAGAQPQVDDQQPQPAQQVAHQLQQLQQPAPVPVQFQHFQHPQQQHQQHSPHPQHGQQHHQQLPTHPQYSQHLHHQHAHPLAAQHPHHQPLSVAPSMLMPAPSQPAPAPIMPTPAPAVQPAAPPATALPGLPGQQLLAAVQTTGDVITIPVEDFNRYRNAVNTAVDQLCGVINRFRTETRRQLALLGGEPVPDDGRGDPFTALLLPGGDGGDDKKSRKRRTHDPNAPKRPLTPYFLYLQYARSIIAADLGPTAPKGAVQEEGLRRWTTMPTNEKNAWNNAYQYNLRLYNARVHAFKSNIAGAKDMSDHDASVYADQNNIAMPPLAGDVHNDAGVVDADIDDNDNDNENENALPELAHSDTEAHHTADHSAFYQAQGQLQLQPEGAANHEDAETDEAAADTKAPKKAASRKRKTADADSAGAKAAAASASPAPKKPRRVAAGKSGGDETAESKKPSRKKAAKA